MVDNDPKRPEEITPENSTPNHSSASEETSQWKDQFLRVSADFQNFKKRAERERGEITKYAQMGVIEKLLPLIDDLERALIIPINASQNPEVKSWVEGLSLIEKKISKFLSDLAVEQITTNGMFDPRYHEALIEVEVAGKKAGEIVEVLSKGYKIGESIIRHAKVTVAK